MTVLSKPLVTAKYAANTETTEYTAATATRAILDKFTGYNGSASAVLLTIKLVPAAGTAGASHVIANKSLAADETYTFPEVVGHVLEPGGFVSVLAATASAVVIRLSGREVS